jgi:murein DD-endopeptidase MepM/ murein hydrolase activator NlpD
MKTMLRRLLPVLLAAVLLVPAAPAVQADDASDLKELQAEQARIADRQKSAQSALERIYFEKEQTRVSIKLTENKLATARAKVKTAGAELEQTRADLARLQTELKQTEETYAQQKKTFGTRLRAVNEMGPVNYFGVLMGSASFSDFISRWDRIAVIVKHDNQVVREIKATKTALDNQRRDVQAKETAQKDLLAQAQESTRTVEAEQARLKELEAGQAAQEAELQAQLAAYDQEQERIESEIYAVQLRMKRAGGKFDPAYPFKKRYPITCEFGLGDDPIYGGTRSHHGIDIGASMGTPILAIEDGVVIYTGFDSVYGNRIVIDHGGGISSWYGHTSKILVKVGQEVKQGEQIGLVGTTGMSTGPHLHLEIRVNNVAQQPRDYIQF